MCIWPTEVVHKTYKKCTSDLQLMTASNLQKCTFDLKEYIRPQKVYISDLQLVTFRSTKRVHSTYKSANIRPTKSVHSTYKKCTSDLQKVFIRPTKSVHPTYKKCIHPTYEKCTSDLQKVYIRPTKRGYIAAF